MDNKNGNPEEEISALSLELLFSPGLFVIPVREAIGSPEIRNRAGKEESEPRFSMEWLPAGQSLSEPAATMLARMGQFIAGTLLPKAIKTEAGSPARYRVVFGGARDLFSMQVSEDGVTVCLPDAETLAASPEGKARAAEALKRWAAACSQDMERMAKR